MEIVRLARRGAIADKIHDDRLARRPRSAQQPVGHLGRWRLGDEDDDFCLGVAAEEIEALVGRHRAHGLGQVAPAGAQGVGDAPAQLVDAGADLLQSGSRGSDHANGAAAHPVGKAQAHAVDDGRAAVRAHDQQPFFSGHLFERRFVIQRDVVAVEEDVLAQAQRLAGHAGGVAARHRDEHPAGIGQHLGRRFQALGQVVLLDAPAPAGEQLVHLVQGCLGGSAVLRLDDDDQVVGGGSLGFGGQQAGLGQDVLVGLGAHHHAGVEDTRQGGQGSLQLHQDYRVIVRARPDLCFRNWHG